jgi:hypothetical protein
MASPDFWERIPELSTIAVSVAGLGSPVRMRGSVARTLHQLAKNGKPIHSLFESVPALADIDLVAQTAASARDLHERIFRELGESRFFHWEIKTEEDVARYVGLANVQILREPEILFSSGKQIENLGDRAFLHVYYDSAERRVIYRDYGPGPTERIRLISEGQLKFPQFALADLLYLVRRYPSNPADPAIEALADYLKKYGGASVAKTIGGASNRRTVFCYLKYLVSHFAYGTFAPTGLVPLLGADFLEAFAGARTDGDPLRAMVNIDLGRSNERRGLVCTVVPRLETAGPTRKWIRRVERVSAYNVESSAISRQIEFQPMIAEAETPLEGISVIGPPAQLEVDDPPDPGCCRFKDFDRGVAEFVWVDPSGHGIHPRLGLVAAGDIDRERAQFFTYSFVSGSSASSLRCDYNFLCIGAGSKRSLNVYRIEHLNAN